MKQYLGNSRGYWERRHAGRRDEELQRQTSIGGNGIGTRHSDQMTLTERLARVDPEMLEYRATIDDPLTYAAPWTVRMMWTTQPGYEIFEYFVSRSESGRLRAGSAASGTTSSVCTRRRRRDSRFRNGCEPA